MLPWGKHLEVNGGIQVMLLHCRDCTVPAWDTATQPLHTAAEAIMSCCFFNVIHADRSLAQLAASAPMLPVDECTCVTTSAESRFGAPQYHATVAWSAEQTAGMF